MQERNGMKRIHNPALLAFAMICAVIFVIAGN